MMQPYRPQIFVCQLPVAALDPRPTSRVRRRRARYGKQSVFAKLQGKISPKQLREGIQ